VADFSRVLSQYVDALAVRTFGHEVVEEIARHATIPIINALSDDAHPCQALGDMLTIREALGRTDGVRLAFVGDGNNVARSLAIASAFLGVEFVLSCPEGYSFPAEFEARLLATFPNAALTVEHDPKRAVSGAEVVYTDVWTSMGQEAEAGSRRLAFEAFRVD